MKSSTGTKDTNSNSKKAEDFSKMLENIRKQGSNKQCFDCGEKGTTYVVVNFGTFVCTRCSGIHRDLSYKVKGIGVCNFSESDLALLTKMGNDNAKNIWLAKFESKKEKMPDPKDFEAVKKHITAKYKDKKYSVKQSEKEISGDGHKSSQSKNNKKEESSEEDSDSESETEKEKVAKKNSKTSSGNANNNKINAVTPVENSNPKKLTPLNVKNTQTANFNVNNSKSKMKENNNATSNSKASDWTEQRDFTFFDFNSENKGNNKGAQTANKTTTNNSLIDPNLFTFTNNEVSSPQTGNNQHKNNNLNDWGIVWENPSQTTKSANNNNNNILNNFEFFDADLKNNQTNTKLETKIQQSSNNTQSPNLNPFDFNFVGGSPTTANTSTTINPKTNSQNSTLTPQNNISGLSQNLSAIYVNNPTTTSSQNQSTTSNTNPNKKNYDDLDKYLSDPSLFAPNNPNPTQTHSTSYSPNLMNMNNMNTINQSTPSTNNNMFIMNPQMMQQMQMMMMNPQMQSNPQMMQYMQLMFQNMMANMNMNTVGMNSMGMNMTGSLSTQSKGDPHLNDLNDLNFGLNGINLSTQSNIPNQTKIEETSQKFDAFKDIYNYSKQSNTHPPVKENKSLDNMNFNLNSKSNNSNNNLGSTHYNTLSNNTNATAYNPFDF